MAAYGATSNKGADDAAGLAYLTKLFKNIPVQDDSARKALQTFTDRGKGDALLDYEDDLIFAQKNGAAIDYTIPSPNILIENPIAVTSDSKHPVQAKAFVDFVEAAGRAADPGSATTALPGPVRHDRRHAELPDPARPVHDRRPRWLAHRDDQVLRPQKGRARRDREVEGRPATQKLARLDSSASHRRTTERTSLLIQGVRKIMTTPVTAPPSGDVLDHSEGSPAGNGRRTGGRRWRSPLRAAPRSSGPVPASDSVRR